MRSWPDQNPLSFESAQALVIQTFFLYIIAHSGPVMLCVQKPQLTSVLPLLPDSSAQTGENKPTQAKGSAVG